MKMASLLYNEPVHFSLILVTTMLPFRTNFALCVSGPSKSGKTSFCVKLLNNADRMIDKKFHKIYWVLGDENAIPKNLNVPVEFIVGVPDEFVNQTGQPCLWVLDDSMFETENKSVANLLTRGSHHQDMSVIFITQNLYQQGKYARTMSLNYTHLCVMNNPRDKQQFQFLARQLYPENSKELLRVYNEITQEPYSYLLIDLTQATHHIFRFRTDIFNPFYATIFCSALPPSINDELIQHEVCGEGSAYAACFKEQQL